MEAINVSAPAPRVNSSMLSGFIGRKVILVGKYEGMEGNTLKLKAADDGMVAVALNCPAPQADVIEVQGTVSTPTSINAESTVAFSSNFDMANYNELVKLSNGDFKAMFV